MRVRPSWRLSQMDRLDLISVPLLLAVPLLFAVLLLACDGQEATAPGPSLSGAGNGPKGRNAEVHVTPESDTLDALNATLQLTANAPVTWMSLNPSVATVDASGQVVSVGSGLGRIEALGIGGRKADTAEILVRQLVAAVQVTPDSLDLPQESMDTLTAAAADANGYAIMNVFVTWVSDLTEIATVSDGVVTGVDTGTTTIRATVDGITGTARVRVVEPPANPYP
jgi:uncharacterized protein YjdB